MAQDPNSTYGTNPQNPYGTPPQNPYGVPPTQAAPQNSSGAPQMPYPPPTDPYSGSPYGQQPMYGAPGPGYAPQAPLPLGEAIKQLPNHYLRVTTKPSAATFAAELPMAAWDITWIQLLFLVVGKVLFGFIATLLVTAATSSMRSPNTPMAMIGSMTGMMGVSSVISAWEQLIFVPAGFFLGMGIQYLLAKALRGEGTFLAQCYSALLYQVPLGIIAALLAIIPFLGGIAGLGLGIYSIVLNVFQIQASHRLSAGKATAVVLLPIGVLLLLFFIIIAITGIAAFLLYQHSTTP